MFKSKLTTLLIGLGLFIPALAICAPASAVSDICNINNGSVSQEVKNASGCGGSTPKLQDVITGIINGVIAVVGLVAVAYIVYGGIQYMTSAGDAGKTIKARNTIFYAAIGLVICALSFVIVNFVIVQLIAGGGSGGSSSGTGIETVGNNKSNLAELVTGIINGVIAVLGIVCVAFMVSGGVNYMTSAGDTSKIEKAKKTLLYAGIGLIICVLAFSITNFVIKNLIAGQAVSSGTSSETSDTSPDSD